MDRRTLTPAKSPSSGGSSDDVLRTLHAVRHTVTRVVVGDPAQVVLAGLHAFLSAVEGVEIVGETTTPASLESMLVELKPDVVILDSSLCGPQADTDISRLREACSSAQFLVLSDRPSIDGVEAAFRAGASGYVVKDDDAADLPDIVRRIHSGRTYISSSVSQLMLRGNDNQGAVNSTPLTNREQQILELIVSGKNSREIGNALGIKLRTVHTHRSRIMAKLDVHTATKLVSKAISSGLVHVEPTFPRAAGSA